MGVLCLWISPGPTVRWRAVATKLSMDLHGICDMDLHGLSDILDLCWPVGKRGQVAEFSWRAVRIIYFLRQPLSLNIGRGLSLGTVIANVASLSNPKFGLHLSGRSTHCTLRPFGPYEAYSRFFCGCSFCQRGTTVLGSTRYCEDVIAAVGRCACGLEHLHAVFPGVTAGRLRLRLNHFAAPPT